MHGPAPSGAVGLCCGNACLDVASDPQNCGGCGQNCAAGQTCVEGSCVSGVSATTCTGDGGCNLPDGGSGLCCSGACVDPISDLANCGACGFTCFAGATCSAQGCVAPSCSEAFDNARCLPADAGVGICCGGSCIAWNPDFFWDPANCGGCGYTCPAGTNCSVASCAANCFNNGSNCPSGDTCVGTGAYSASCLPSSCAADGGQAACAIDSQTVGTCCGASCVDLSGLDPSNCGACGHVCPAGDFCDFGLCWSKPTCGAATQGYDCPLTTGGIGTCCGAGCVDVYSDRQNCGTCGHACAAGEICVTGSCLPTTCTGGSACALLDGGPGTCCGSACVDPNVGFDTQQDCFICGAACPTGSTCQSGACLTAAGAVADCGDGGCPAGETCLAPFGCVLDACASGTTAKACAIPGAINLGRCCGDACVNPGGDNSNCGGCGIACSSAQTCVFGYCEPAAACGAATQGQPCRRNASTGTCCGAACIDSSSDPANCGGCGSVCPQGGVCSQGQCVADGGGFATCDATTNIGCPSGLGCNGFKCVPRCDTGVTPCYCDEATNAGCPPGFGCYQGNSCLPYSCDGGATACLFGAGVGGALVNGGPGIYVNGQTGVCCAGRCVEVGQDPENCGGCGIICPGGFCTSDSVAFDDSNVTCSSPAGVVCGNECNTGNGACTDLSSDPTNCGGCGVYCPGGASCVAGTCAGTPPSCSPGHYLQDCSIGDGGTGICCPTEGCVRYPSNLDCGTCGNNCTAVGAVCLSDSYGEMECGTQTCSGSTDNVYCLLDGGSFGGCCAGTCLDLSSDPNNCGGCGQQCASRQTCQFAVCQ